MKENTEQHNTERILSEEAATECMYYLEVSARIAAAKIDEYRERDGFLPVQLPLEGRTSRILEAVKIYKNHVKGLRGGMIKYLIANPGGLQAYTEGAIGMVCDFWYAITVRDMDSFRTLIHELSDKVKSLSDVERRNVVSAIESGVERLLGEVPSLLNISPIIENDVLSALANYEKPDYKEEFKKLKDPTRKTTADIFVKRHKEEIDQFLKKNSGRGTNKKDTLAKFAETKGYEWSGSTLLHAWNDSTKP
jgi:hypothetical protein